MTNPNSLRVSRAELRPPSSLILRQPIVAELNLDERSNMRVPSMQFAGGMATLGASYGLGVLGDRSYNWTGAQLHLHGAYSRGSRLSGWGPSLTLFLRDMQTAGLSAGIGLGFYYSAYIGYITIPAGVSAGARAMVSNINIRNEGAALFSVEATANVAVTALGALELALGLDASSQGQVGAHIALNFTLLGAIAAPQNGL